MVGSHHTSGSLAPVTVIWNDFLSVQCASSEHLKQHDLLSLPDIEITTQDRLRWAVEAAVEILIPLDWLAVNTAGCIAAYQFLKALSNLLTAFGDSTEAHSSDLASYQEYLLDIVITEMFGRIRKSVELGDPVVVPPISYAMGLLTDWLRDSSHVNAFGVLRRIAHYWELLGLFLTLTLKTVIFHQNGVQTDAQEVTLYEILRLWKYALRCSVQWSENSSLHNDPTAFLVLSRTLHTCLVTYPLQTAERNRMGNQNLTQLRLHSTVIHVLLRSLHSLNKMATETELLCKEVRSTVDATICGLVCGFESSLLAEVEPGPIASYLAKAESQRSLESKLQIDLLTPDPSPCLRLILLNGLELCVRLDPSTETVQCLARSLYSIVLSTRNLEAELATFEELLVQLLSGDDSHLFQCLNLWLELEDRLYNCISTQQSLLKMVPDAHWAFARLAQIIGYSAHLLVDWIVSPETNCLTYLIRYLRRFRDPDRCRSVAPTITPTMGNTSLPAENISHWPRAELKDMLRSVAHCLHTLNSRGNVPFNPLPLIRSINHALSVI